jgi:hypothetical protein
MLAVLSDSPMASRYMTALLPVFLLNANKAEQLLEYVSPYRSEREPYQSSFLREVAARTDSLLQTQRHVHASESAFWESEQGANNRGNLRKRDDDRRTITV